MMKAETGRMQTAIAFHFQSVAYQLHEEVVQMCRTGPSANGDGGTSVVETQNEVPEASKFAPAVSGGHVANAAIASKNFASLNYA